jgi:hypothetical protein
VRPGRSPASVRRSVVDARQQIEDLVGLEQFYVIEEETVEKTRWGKR